ncbi:MAG TPA: hypothetical protein VK539_12645, partial [Myxococcaceae bacterium]|nr:hypothetical protein [Myxococcaceae bacterium]
MDPIGRRPSTPRLVSTPVQADTRPAATAKAAAASAVGFVQQSRFDAPVTRAQAAQPMPGAWRGGPD